jgi:hypothetical protein
MRELPRPFAMRSDIFSKDKAKLRSTQDSSALVSNL